VNDPLFKTSKVNLFGCVGLCGIIGIIGEGGNIVEELYRGLRLLEYRGYDSAGMAVINDKGMEVVKDKGTIEKINERYNFLKLSGYVGIAHTRWATHGAPDKVNAHPHVDCTHRIAVVHNGIIENYLELREELESKGHIFRSRTDTEVIPHLIEDYISQGLSFRDSFVSTLRRLRGAYALAAISTYSPDIIMCARVESPLVVGLGGGRGYCSSDIPSLIVFTNKVVPLGEGEYAIVRRDDVEIRRIKDDSLVKRSFKTVSMTVEEAKKEGYPHFMLKEIYEQPYSIKYALELQKNYLDLMTSFIDRASRLFFVAAGTSFHAGMVGSYVFSRLSRMVSIPVIASEFVSLYGGSISVDDVILAISQSGETRDVLWAVEYAKARGATVLAVVNVLASTLTRVARVYLHQQSGPEIGVAATKTYTGQLATLYLLSLNLAKYRGKLGQDEYDMYLEELYRMPEVVRETISSVEGDMKSVAKRIKNSKYVIFLGRGVNTATAHEGRLKLMEISYIPSLSYPAGENKHGPISLIEKGVPVIALVQDDETKKLMISNIQEVRSRGAETIVITSSSDNETREVSDTLIEVPKTHSLFTPITYVVPLQLLAYYTAVYRGLDPDKPRNLAKSVTVI